MKIKAIPKYYYGFLQGYKVYINWKKYPSKYAHFYTTKHKNIARQNAISDYKKEL